MLGSPGRAQAHPVWTVLGLALVLLIREAACARGLRSDGGSSVEISVDEGAMNETLRKLQEEGAVVTGSDERRGRVGSGTASG